MSTFLSRAEVAELTGCHRKAGQERVLKANRIPYSLNAQGWPMVARAAIEGRAERAPQRRTWTPPRAA